MRGPRLITSSSARCYRLCPRKYRLSYVQGLRPKRDAFALRFGTLWHALMEVWWGVPADEVAIPSDVDPFDRAKANAMLAGYTARWRDHQDFEVIAIERPFQVPLRDGAGREVEGWAVAGKVDGLIRQDGRNLLLEHKTTSEDLTLGGDYWAHLTLDLQVSLYYAGAAALGHPVEACLYDVAAKPQLRSGAAVPVLDENGEKIVVDARGQRVTTKDGKRWRQTQDSALGYRLQTRFESPVEYERRVLEAIAERPNDFYARAEVVRLDGELNASRDDLVGTVRLIEWSTEHGYWPRNDHACFEWGRCAYWPLCSGTGSEDDYRRVEDVHPELERSAA